MKANERINELKDESGEDREKVEEHNENQEPVRQYHKFYIQVIIVLEGGRAENNIWRIVAENITNNSDRQKLIDLRNLENLKQDKLQEKRVYRHIIVKLKTKDNETILKAAREESNYGTLPHK